MSRLVPVLAVLLAACSGCVVNLCNPTTDVSYCEGTVRWTCPEPGVDQIVPDRWITKDCAEAQQVCVVAGEAGAICADAAEPHAACTGDAQAVCESATLARSCVNGYSSGTRDCRACEVDPEHQAITCHGGFGSTCTSDDDCASTLRCGETSRCVAR